MGTARGPVLVRRQVDLVVLQPEALAAWVQADAEVAQVLRPALVRPRALCADRAASVDRAVQSWRLKSFHLDVNLFVALCDCMLGLEALRLLVETRCALLLVGDAGRPCLRVRALGGGSPVLEGAGAEDLPQEAVPTSRRLVLHLNGGFPGVLHPPGASTGSRRLPAGDFLRTLCKVMANWMPALHELLYLLPRGTELLLVRLYARLYLASGMLEREEVLRIVSRRLVHFVGAQ